MTMDRVQYNTTRSYEYQQQLQQQQSQPPAPPLPPIISQQQQQQQQSQNLHQLQQPQHLIRNNHNQRPLISHHHNHIKINNHTNGNIHRPHHPPPPPPPVPRASNQCYLPTTLTNTVTTPSFKDTVDHANTGSTDTHSLPTIPVRSLVSDSELKRNSLQNNYYGNTHYQYFQPSNLQTRHNQHHHHHHHHLHHHNLQAQQHVSHNHQQYHLSDQHHSSSNQHLQHNLHSQSTNVGDENCNNNSNDNTNQQDNLNEEVIQAILAAKEALEKPIEKRDERDILLIDNLCSLVHGFDVFPKSVRRALAAQAVLIVIDEKGKVLIVHNEELDSFCVLIFGECEQLNVTKTVPIRNYHVGDAFGVCEPTTETLRFNGHMVTRCENCAFLCVKRDDFYTVLTDPANYPNKEIIRHRDRNGNVVCVSQFNIDKKSTGPLWSHHMQSTNPFKIILPDGHTITKATESCLLMALVDGYDRIDPEYVDDFLLLFRVFMTYDMKDRDKRVPPGMIKLCLTLAKWLEQPNFRDKVVKIVLTWLSSYYHDFELNADFSYLFFRVLESRLLNLSMNNQLHLLHVTLSTKSKIRYVTISRSSREKPLNFSISGGYEKNCGIFVTQVSGLNNDDNPLENFMVYLDLYPLSDGLRSLSIAPRSKVSHNLFNQELKPGDQILEVNGTNFAAIKLVEAQKKLDMSTHLSLKVRYNPSAFHEMRALPEGKRKSSLSSVSSVSPYCPSNSQSRFTFSLQDHQNIKQNDQYPPASPLFSTNADFGFRSIIRTVPKNDKSRLTNMIINSSKHLVKQFRESTALNNLETMSKTSDNISDDQSNDVDIGRSKSNPDLPNLKGKQLEPGLSNVIRSDDLNPASIADNSANGSEQALVNVLKVFNAANNEFRYLLVHEETTAREVVMVAVKEFNLTANVGSQSSPGERTVSSLNWHLYEVSVVPDPTSESQTKFTIKQKCLSEQTSRLAERASLCSRFYIKNNSQSSFGPTKLDMGDNALVNEILKESPANVTLTTLNATLLAVELTLADFDKFRGIEPQQFVYDTFFDCSEKKRQGNINGSISSTDTASLKSSSSEGQESDNIQLINKSRSIPSNWMQEYREFADISNREMFWVVCEILNERNIGRRVKIVKQFIRVADVCSQLRNYNSMFAIISGLGHSCVNRLKRTFEKLKPKYKNQLEKMRSLFDPSKNMFNYRTCLNQTQPPAIPLFPQIKKDLTFTKEGKKIFVRESNDVSDDEDSGFSQDTIRRKSRGDLLSVKSAIDHPAPTNHLPTIQTRSISYTSFSNRACSSEIDSILVNFAEIRQLTERVRNVIYFSSTPYSNDLLTNAKDTQKNQAQIKKMHEEWQMRKRIRHYINQTLTDAPTEVQQSSGSNCKLDQVDSATSNPKQQEGKVVITYHERTLYQRSLEVEPEMNARPPVINSTSVPLEPRHPAPLPSVQLHLPSPTMTSMHPPPSGANSSPTLSKSSSLSSCSSFNHHLPNLHATRSGNLNSGVGKFGTESTESLRKLQALSENVDEWRSFGGNNNNNNGNIGFNRTTANDVNKSKGIVTSRIFPPKK